ncbi:MAG: addiction module toxin RelE [Nanoarchaeota archaeon]
MFNFNLTEELKNKLEKLSKKDKKKAEIINKKIKEIISQDNESINHYKNLRHDLKEFKRVHIDKHFVLAFKVEIQNNFILFIDFDHHDNIYKILQRNL